jgi:phospholipid N-methyltransferase
MSYYQNREALVQIAGALVDNGWTIFGYKADTSDMMTDYWNPASWDGIATKNGYVLVIDNNNTRYSGYEVKKYNYNKTSYKASDRISKLEAMMNDAASTENEKASCAVLIEKEKEKQGIAPTYTIEEVYPTFAHGNPKHNNWHIEKDGQIVAKGSGAFAVNSYDWENEEVSAADQKAEKLKKFINKIEKILTDSDALKAEVVKVAKQVIKPVQKDNSTINEGDLLSFSYHGHFWIVTKVYTVGEQVRVTYELLGSEKRGYQRKNNAKRYYQPLARLEKEMTEGKVKVYTLQEVTEYVEKTVFKKTKRTVKASDAVQLETKEVVTEQPEQATEAVQTETTSNDTANEDQATKRQLWALHCATKLNTTNLVISKEKASELITKSKAGNNIIDEIKAMLNGESEKVKEKAQETETSYNSKQEKEQDQTQFIDKIDKQIESAQNKLESLSGNHLTNTWKRQQEEASREMKRESLRFDITLLEYLKDKAFNNSMTKLEQALLVGAFRDQLHNYSISRNDFIYPEIDTRYDLKGWYNSEVPKKQKRLHKAGLYNITQLTAAVEEYKAIKDEIKKPVNPIMQKIKKLESDVKFRKIAGYFPTPKNIIEQMLNHADIREGEKILEPSAGNGNILDSITAYIQANGITATIEAVEWNYSLREILELKNYNLVSNDFMEYAKYNHYDKIIMNPPFEKNQDIQHVQHAYKCLKDGGRLVAIMSPHFTFANDTASVNFREWLDGRGYYEKLPEGAFKESGTNVNTVMVVIDKLEETAAEAI